jgi:hypothetical protein
MIPCRPLTKEELEEIDISVNSFIADIEEELDKFQFWDECPSYQIGGPTNSNGQGIIS